MGHQGVVNGTTNVLKTRDDRRPVILNASAEAAGPGPVFNAAEGTEPTWIRPGQAIRPEDLRPRIEPWLTALWQSEHLSVLIGSGITSAVHRMATGAAVPGMAAGDFGDLQDVVNGAAEESAHLAGRKSANLEDQLRVASELLRGLEILGRRDTTMVEQARALKERLGAVIETFVDAVITGERNLSRASGVKAEAAFNYVVSFLMSFASRTGTRDRLHIFTTNYDRVIEAGAAAAGMHLVDRFVGPIAPVFRSSRIDLDLHYNPPGIRGEPRYVEGVARFTKLHGSVDWVERGRSIVRAGVPFGAQSIKPYLADIGVPSGVGVMIYPNAAKDRETAAYPYVDLFRDFAAAICRPNHTLVTFGCSFGDEHINRVIEDMLTIPSTHLVIISYDDRLGRIIGTYEKLGRHAQVTLLVGDHVGEFQSVVDRYLPKPAIDRTTLRMSELLRVRWGVAQSDREDRAKDGGESAERP